MPTAKTRRLSARIIRAVTEPLWQRDRLEMRAVDVLLSAVAPTTATSKATLNRDRHTTAEKEHTMIRMRKWTGFRSVLCPIDFSEDSQRALQYAVAIALRAKAVLRVVYVNDPLLIAAAAAALHDLRLAKRSARELQLFVNGTVPATARKQLRVTSHIAIGDPSDQILKAANSYRTDLIVLGTHGLTGATRLFMGSTTLSVLQRAAVPVLAVPRGGQNPVAAVSRTWPGKRIVAAVELEGEATSEIESAARIAQWFGSSLVLAHVVSDIAAPAWLSADLSAHERIRIAQAQRQMAALAAVAQRHVETDAHVVCGSIADEISALAAAERTDLLITALHDRRAWFGAKRGSISYHVLSHAVTPVLACPPQWRPR
jgi:nucleotide-binding universal stress UspA family protein